MQLCTNEPSAAVGSPPAHRIDGPLVKPRKGSGADDDVLDRLLAGADLKKYKTTFLKVSLKHNHGGKKGLPTKLKIELAADPKDDCAYWYSAKSGWWKIVKAGKKIKELIGKCRKNVEGRPAAAPATATSGGAGNGSGTVGGGSGSGQAGVDVDEHEEAVDEVELANAILEEEEGEQMGVDEVAEQMDSEDELAWAIHEEEEQEHMDVDEGVAFAAGDEVEEVGSQVELSEDEDDEGELLGMHDDTGQLRHVAIAIASSCRANSAEGKAAD